MRTFIKKYALKEGIHKKIVLLSDIHYYKGTKDSFLFEIAEKVSKLKPDYICIAGDLVDLTNVREQVSMEPFYEFFRKLGSICPVIVVLGNHDVKAARKTYFEDSVIQKELKSISNVFLLRNEGIEFEDIYFMGYEPSFRYYEIEKEKDKELFLKEAKGKLKASKKYSVLLVHTPVHMLEDYYEPLNLKRYSLILCGHTHGGMMPSWVPGNRGIVSPTKEWFPKNIRGKLQRENTTLIISSGIMKLSYCSEFFYTFRNFYGGEITFLELK